MSQINTNVYQDTFYRDEIIKVGAFMCNVVLSPILLCGLFTDFAHFELQTSCRAYIKLIAYTDMGILTPLSSVQKSMGLTKYIIN